MSASAKIPLSGLPHGERRPGCATSTGFGITALTVTPDPVRIATEGAVWGSIKVHGLLSDTVILSDDAGQFALGRHALCRVHAARLVHRLDTFTERQHAARQFVRALIW